MDWVAKGRLAEARAVHMLRGLGYEILAKNLRTKSGELDVIAIDGAVLVIVEVRYRERNLREGWRSLSRRKRASLAQAAREARALLRIPASTRVRFDVVLAAADGATHLRGALSPRRPYRA